MILRAVLWDVGGPINTEEDHEAETDAGIRAAFAELGIGVDDDSYQAACEFAVSSYAPDAYKAIIWHLSRHDEVVSRQAYDLLLGYRPGPIHFQIRPGVPALLSRLHEGGTRLGLVANQPASTLDVLKEIGIGQYFAHMEVSATSGLRKPDVRIFLAACDALDVEPQECIMVGDRIDNDIAPARSLGMKTVLFRHGRHRRQQPRSWDEAPHRTVENVQELSLAIDRLLGLAR